MVRHQGEYLSEIRKNMRGGNGEALIEHLWTAGSELHSPIRMFGRLTLKPGSSIGFHNHDNEEEVFYILNGTAQVSDNGEIKVLKAGDTIRTGDGGGHAIENIGDTPVELIAVIAKYV